MKIDTKQLTFTFKPLNVASAAGQVAKVTDKGTFCVYSPITNGQFGECLSCSLHGSSVRSQHTKQTVQVKHIALSSPEAFG